MHYLRGPENFRQRVKLFDHNPWGLDRFASVQDSERHRFTAHQRDLGLLDRSWDDVDFMHARFFDAYLGRMYSPDPVPAMGFFPGFGNLFYPAAFPKKAAFERARAYS